MRFFNTQQVARPWPPDRNNISKISIYSASNVAPHGATTRWTYTCPAGRKFDIASGFIEIMRDAVATTAAYAFIEILVQPNGGGFQTVMQIGDLVNTVGVPYMTPGMNGFTMTPGDAIEAISQDGSTGGSHTMVASIVGNEYDA